MPRTGFVCTYCPYGTVSGAVPWLMACGLSCSLPAGARAPVSGGRWLLHISSFTACLSCLALMLTSDHSLVLQLTKDRKLFKTVNCFVAYKVMAHASDPQCARALVRVWQLQ